MAQAQLDRNRIGDAIDQIRHGLRDQAAQDARRDLARRVVHGDQPGTERRPVGVVEHLVTAHRQLGAARTNLERTTRDKARAGLERAREMALVEPRQRELARVVAQPGLQDP